MSNFNFDFQLLWNKAVRGIPMCLIAGHWLSSSGFQGAKVNIKWGGQVQTWSCQSKAVCGQSLATMVGGERNVTKKRGGRGYSNGKRHLEFKSVKRTAWDTLFFFQCNKADKEGGSEDWIQPIFSKSKPRTHPQQRRTGKRETQGGWGSLGGKQGNWERRVECPGSHDITQMALFLGSTWRGCAQGPTPASPSPCPHLCWDPTQII